MPESCWPPCRCGGGLPPRRTDRRRIAVEARSGEKRAAAAQEAGLKPDAVVYNALITLAGRTGQLQRAMDTVSRMEARPPLPPPSPTSPGAEATLKPACALVRTGSAARRLCPPKIAPCTCCAAFWVPPARGAGGGGGGDGGCAGAPPPPPMIPRDEQRSSTLRGT